MIRPWLRFPPPLHVLVPLVVLACSVLYFLFQGFVVAEWNLDRLVSHYKESTDVYLTRLAESAEGTRPNLERRFAVGIETTQSNPTFRWAGVCDAQGRFLYCTRRDWLDSTVGEVAPERVVTLTAQAATTDHTVMEVNRLDSILAARRVPASPHVPLQYTLLAERELAATVGTRRQEARSSALLSVGMFSLFCLLLWAALYAFLRRRMRDFMKHASLNSSTNAASSPLSGSDEFAEISRFLQKAEQLLKEVAEYTDELIWIVTPDFKPIYLSPAFERIWRRSRDEVYRGPRAMPDYILKEYHATVQDAFVAAFEGRTPHLHVEYRIVRGDGQIRWIQSRGYPVRDANGKIQRMVGISRDITEEKNLQEQIVNISEQERHSLGHDLHDDACQRLAAVKMKSEALTLLLQQENSPHFKLARELTGQIAGTSDLVRNIARGLAPVEVEGDGLMLALRKLVLLQEAIHEVPCFFIEGDTVNVGNKIVATHLYRIAQEFITNAARHAKPERIELRLDQTPDHVRLTVTNDGRPFLEPPAGHTGMGLKIVRYRAGAIGATVNLRPRTDGIPGTVAECLVPHDVCRIGPRNGPPPSTLTDESPQI